MLLKIVNKDLTISEFIYKNKSYKIILLIIKH